LRKTRKRSRSWRSIKQEIQYLSPAEVIFIHIALVKWDPGDQPRSSELMTIRRELLDSAVFIIQHDDYYKGLHYKAAALFRSIVKNHAFIDGNKRTAVVATDVFFGINGYNLQAESDELVKFTLKVAKGYVKDLYVIKTWLDRRTRRFPPEKAEEVKGVWRKIKEIIIPKK